jgi:hypothetical protein
MNITVSIPDERIEYVIGGAGIGYWADVEHVSKNRKILKLRERDTGKVFLVNTPARKKGLEIMAEKYPRHFGDILDNLYDANAGDIFLQCCCFGECKYG